MGKRFEQIQGPQAAGAELCKGKTATKLGIQSREGHLFRINSSLTIQIGNTNLYESPDEQNIMSLVPLQDEDELLIVDFIKKGD